jgi:hypothetical protein
MADFDPSIADKGRMKSTAGVASEQNENGVRLSVPATESANITKNFDENTYHREYDSDGEWGAFYTGKLWVWHIKFLHVLLCITNYINCC